MAERQGGTDGGTDARERLAETRARQERADKRRTRGIVVGVGAVAVAAVAVLAVVVARSGGDDEAPAYTGALAPVSRQGDGSVLMAKAGVTRPVLEIFEDFQCPICKEVEHASGPAIKEMAAKGEARVVYRPFQLFQGAQREPLSSNSHRAANAALCAPAEHWVAYHDALYAHQPDEGDKGFAADDLVAWGRQAGITGEDFAACVRTDAKSAQVAAMTAYAERDRGVTGTPTVVLDGKPLDLQDRLLDPDALREAVRRAR
ncbi:DsbA family protein [Actinomadura parmotrematis]|uniref:DsbA family protein n=1 Tax=Actinomadura parmotrematis TaxID=2864039 RepID=A0ABS7FL39_9ACTN|nr:thioredoxin domain-containing protein [Actinomadura parmotrematis]MBW8481082.1 DsbA family protein [Actinomadura parmotrematis]